MLFIIAVIVFFIFFFIENSNKKNNVNQNMNYYNNMSYQQNMVNNNQVYQQNMMNNYQHNIPNYNNQMYYQNNNMLNYNNPSNKSSIDGFKVALVIGVFLIILSSIIFATSTWQIYTPIVKVLILFLESMLFLILGLVLKKKFKVTSTGDSLTFISMIIIFATILSAGYYKIFGEDFSLFGIYSLLYLGFSFLIEFILLEIRRIVANKENYLFSLITGLLGIFFVLAQITDNFLLTISLFLIFLLIINLCRNKLFKNVNIFNIVNYCIISLSTIILLFSSATQFFLDNIDYYYIILLFLVSSANVIISFYKIETCNIFSILYFGMFGLLLTFLLDINNISILLIAVIFILNILSFISKNDDIKLTSYLTYQLISIALGLKFIFNPKLAIFMILIFIGLLLLTLYDSKKNNNKIFNYVMQIIHTIFIMFGFINLMGITSLRNIILVLNITMLILYLIFSFTKSKIRVFYFMPLILGLIIQNIGFNNIYLKIISLVLLFILSVYTHFNEVGLTKKINNILCLLYLFNLFSIVEYSILFSFIFALSLFVFALLKNKERIKIVYLSLLVVPIFNIFDYIKLPNNILNDIAVVLSIIFILLITRLYKLIKNEIATSVVEIYLVLNIIMFSSKITALIIISLLIMLSLLLNKKEHASSLIYNIFIMGLIFIYSFTAESIYYFLSLLSLLFINQAINKYVFKNNKIANGIINYVITLILICTSAFNLEFSLVYLFIETIIILGLMIFTYSNKKMKFLGLLILELPIILKLNVINIDFVIILLTNTIIFDLYARKVFKFENAFVNIMEYIFIPIIYLSYIFMPDLKYTIILGIFSFIYVIIGHILKNKALLILGYITIIALAIIKTFAFWSSLPWWFYLLLTGIGCVLVAAYIESKKK